MPGRTDCESCAHFLYDEEALCSYCECDLDEDEMLRFLTAQTVFCPYYTPDDEYAIVRKQN